MHFKNSSPFVSIIILCALFLSTCAAYYSVVGISSLFSGAAISASIMAITLEIGKLVSVSYLFRYWDKANLFLKIYLSTAIFLLMVITSSGIFGYLSYAYQKSALQHATDTSMISMQESNKKDIEEKIKMSQRRISSLNQSISIQETRLSDAINNPMLIRNINDLKTIQNDYTEIINKNKQDINAESKHIEQFQSKINEINGEILKIQISSESKRDIVTLKFVSDMFGLPVDIMVKYFIILLIIVFDPLAVCLLMAYNTISPSNTNQKSVDVNLHDNTTHENESKFKKILRKSFQYCVKNKGKSNDIK